MHKDFRLDCPRKPAAKKPIKLVWFLPRFSARISTISMALIPAVAVIIIFDGETV